MKIQKGLWAAATILAAGSWTFAEEVTFKEAKLYEVTAKKARVRADHDSSSRTIKILKRHQALEVIGKSNSWKQISSPVKGWIYEGFVRFGLKRFVTASSLNVHDGPSRSAHVKKRLKRRTEVHVIDKKGNWRHIDKPVHGWVHEKFLSSKRPKKHHHDHIGPASAAGFVQLPRSPTGIFWYCPYSTHHWGIPRLVSKILTMGRQWSPRRIGSGDMSLPNGGYFPPHATHRDGHAADFEPMTTSGSGGATVVGYGSYSTYWNQRFVNLMYSTPTTVAFVLHNNSRISRVQYSYGHDNHLHMAVY